MPSYKRLRRLSSESAHDVRSSQTYRCDVIPVAYCAAIVIVYVAVFVLALEVA